MSDEVGSRTQAIVFAAGMLFAAPFSGGLSLLALPLAIPIARGSGEKKEEKEKPSKQNTFSPKMDALHRYPFCNHGNFKDDCSSCRPTLTNRVPMLLDDSLVTRLGENRCWVHHSAKPCWLCDRNALQTYSYNTSVYSPPSPEAVIANKDPERAAKLLERLSSDSLIKETAGPAALELARQGHGVTIDVLRERSWFSSDERTRIRITKT